MNPNPASTSGTLYKCMPITANASPKFLQVYPLPSKVVFSSLLALHLLLWLDYHLRSHWQRCVWPKLWVLDRGSSAVQQQQQQQQQQQRARAKRVPSQHLLPKSQAQLQVLRCFGAGGAGSSTASRSNFLGKCQKHSAETVASFWKWTSTVCGGSHPYKNHVYTMCIYIYMGVHLFYM